MNILGKRSDLPFSRKSDRKKEKSTVSFTHVQNIICSQTKSQTQLDGIAHEQTIICTQLFAGHVMGSRPMKRKKNSLRMVVSNIQLKIQLNLSSMATLETEESGHFGEVTVSGSLTVPWRWLTNSDRRDDRRDVYSRTSMSDHLPKKATTYPKHRSFQVKSGAPNDGFLPRPKYIILSKTVI